MLFGKDADKKEADKKAADKKTIIIKMCLFVALGALLSLLLMFPARGIMNAVSRLDYISQRLDDYPRMRAVDIQETEARTNWWQKEVFGQRAKQAVYIYTMDQKYSDEAEKLAYIAQVLAADNVRIVSEADVPAGNNGRGDNSQAENLIVEDGTLTVWEKLDDGRYIVLDFSGSTEAWLKNEGDDSYFLSQVEAGLPGYMCMVRDGEMSIYPADDKEEALRGMIGSMIDSGALDQAKLAEKARKSGNNAALKLMLNSGAGNIPAGKYLLYSAAYADNGDLVINISHSSDLFRFARKRSWALWFLCIAVMALVARSLWRTRLYIPGLEPKEQNSATVKKSIPIMAVAVLLILGSVIVIQMISGVNLAQQGATDLAVYLKKNFDYEYERASNVEENFDMLYLERAGIAVEELKGNPQLIDTDSLYSLDRALNGDGLRVFNAEGDLLASDELLRNAVDTGKISTVSLPSDDRENEGSESDPQDGEDGRVVRRYRAVMENDEDRTIGWVELCAEQSRLDELLRDSGIEESIGDLHLLDTLHAVAVENTDEGRIVASNTWEEWIGDPAGDYGIHMELLYDGYEGIVNFDGNKCYSVVFVYDNKYVIVGSENETALVFIGGVFILTLLLSLVTYFAVYRPLSRLIPAYQKQVFEEAPEGKTHAAGKELPVLKEFFRDFMIAVFLLSVVLYFVTQGNPTGLTYNIVRGTWSRGVNAATVTTCIMLISMLFAIGRAIDLLLERMSRYLSPRDMTILQLLASAIGYLGPIALIIYALSMFGVNTTTLIGGVGATALIFTLGANSLIADVLAGIFIIMEGDCTVGDVVVIDDFRGIVTDLTMRTIKLMDENTRDVRIINNSKIEKITNQSRENSVVFVDVPISYSVGLDRGEIILKDALAKLPALYPQIIGTPQYWGISTLPEKNVVSGKLGPMKARIAFECLESDKIMLTYQVYRFLVELVDDLNAEPPA